MDGQKICTCMCHQKGIQMMHFMGCCDFTYEQYINKDGSIDMEAYNKLKEENV